MVMVHMSQGPNSFKGILQGFYGILVKGLLGFPYAGLDMAHIPKISILSCTSTKPQTVWIIFAGLKIEGSESHG